MGVAVLWVGVAVLCVGLVFSRDGCSHHVVLPFFYSLSSMCTVWLNCGGACSWMRCTNAVVELVVG